MDLRVFDVEHGACALLTCDDNTRLMIDCGHNGYTGWRPGDYLSRSGVAHLDMLAVTNYDEDHVSGLENLFSRVNVGWLWRNTEVSASLIRNLKSDTGMGPGIDKLVYEIENTYTGTGVNYPSFEGLSRKAFFSSPGIFDDENNLSMAVFLTCHGHTILFPGDLERRGWLELLKKESFKTALQGVDVLVASHHGRESGCCEEIFEYFRPYYVIISDKGYAHETQETLGFYRRFTKGGPFRGEHRHILTTRNDGAINLYFHANGDWGAY